MALLEVKDFHYYYGNIHVVKGINLSVDEGEIVTLIGANGAGKTTTMQTISGLTAAAARPAPCWRPLPVWKRAWRGCPRYARPSPAPTSTS